MDAATGLTVSVDGDPLRKLLKSPEKYRIPSTVFSITVPAQNFFGEGLAPGTYSPAIGDGFYVMLKPLDVGRHTLRFQGTTMGFSVDTTYLLDVVPTRLE